MNYIHSDDAIIDAFVKQNIHNKSDIRTVCDDLLIWFDNNVKYSRLNAPFFPLQRSDLDVVAMLSGTCGDYSNLIVSVLQKLGYEAMYAYVHKDCYGDDQDHICAAVRDVESWILIDATQPYRKWYGFNCPHREYELLSSAAFEEKMKAEEAYWTDVANQYGNELYAGLLYAPWVHEEIIRQSETTFESVFFLLLLDERRNATLYAYYKKYSKENGSIPMMGIISNGTVKYCFSFQKPNSIWDSDQWSQEYSEEDIPDEFKTTSFDEFKSCISRVAIDIDRLMHDLV